MCKATRRKGTERRRERNIDSEIEKVWGEEWEGLKIAIIRQVALIGPGGVEDGMIQLQANTNRAVSFWINMLLPQLLLLSFCLEVNCIVSS